jgi:hypothetical protein
VAAVSAASVIDDLASTAIDVLALAIFPLWIVTAPITLPIALGIASSSPFIGPTLGLIVWGSVPYIAAYALVQSVFNWVRSLLPGAAAQPTSTAGSIAAQTPTSTTATANAREDVTGSAARTRAQPGRKLVNDVRRPNPLANTVTGTPPTATANNTGHTPSAASVGETNSGPAQTSGSGKKLASNSAAARSARGSKT